jgi:hypothetical protein
LIGIDVEADRAAEAPETSVSAGGTLNLPLKLVNRFGAVSAAVDPAALGSAFQTTRAIAQGEQQLYEVIVPKGARSLRARVSDVADVDADLDIYLFDCTAAARKPVEEVATERDKGNKAPPMAAPLAEPKAKAATVDREGEVEVLDPAPGRWVIVVDGYRIPGGRTSYTYLDVFTHPQLGALAVSNTSERRESGGQWMTSGHVWIASVPDAPRILMAEIAVTSSEVRTISGSSIGLGRLYLSLGPSAQSRRAGHWGPNLDGGLCVWAAPGEVPETFLKW